MLTLKQAQRLHRLHLKVIEAEQAWKDCLNGPRGQMPEHRKALDAQETARLTR